MALFPYTSAEAGDLNFNQGEVILVVKKEGEWWTGVIADRTGIFPSNYVQKADTQVQSMDTFPSPVASLVPAPDLKEAFCPKSSYPILLVPFLTYPLKIYFHVF